METKVSKMIQNGNQGFQNELNGNMEAPHMWSTIVAQNSNLRKRGFQFSSFWKPWFPFQFILETLVSILNHFGNLGFHKGVKPSS